MGPSINHAHLTVVFLTSDHVPTLLKLVPKMPNLKMIVCMDTVPSNVATIFKEWSQTQGLVFREFAERLFFLFFYLSYFEILYHS
jgi:long-chain acyl-CoA synthetase